LRIIVLLKVVPSNVASPHLAKNGDRITGKFGPLVMNESDAYALEHAAAMPYAKSLRAIRQEARQSGRGRETVVFCY